MTELMEHVKDSLAAEQSRPTAAAISAICGRRCSPMLRPGEGSADRQPRTNSLLSRSRELTVVPLTERTAMEIKVITRARGEKFVCRCRRILSFPSPGFSCIVLGARFLRY